MASRTLKKGDKAAERYERLYQQNRVKPQPLPEGATKTADQAKAETEGESK